MKKIFILLIISMMLTLGVHKVDAKEVEYNIDIVSDGLNLITYNYINELEIWPKSDENINYDLIISNLEDENIVVIIDNLKVDNGINGYLSTLNNDSESILSISNSPVTILSGDIGNINVEIDKNIIDTDSDIITAMGIRVMKESEYSSETIDIDEYNKIIFVNIMKELDFDIYSLNDVNVLTDNGFNIEIENNTPRFYNNVNVIGTIYDSIGNVVTSIDIINAKILPNSELLLNFDLKNDLQPGIYNYSFRLTYNNEMKNINDFFEIKETIYAKHKFKLSTNSKVFLVVVSIDVILSIYWLIRVIKNKNKLKLREENKKYKVGRNIHS